MSRPNLSAEQRALRARIAALTRAALYDGTAVTAKARSTFLESFEHAVDPSGALAPEERIRRANAALRAHMTRLALASSKARAAKRRAG